MDCKRPNFASWTVICDSDWGFFCLADVVVVPLGAFIGYHVILCTFLGSGNGVVGFGYWKNTRTLGFEGEKNRPNLWGEQKSRDTSSPAIPNKKKIIILYDILRSFFHRCPNTKNNFRYVLTQKLNLRNLFKKKTLLFHGKNLWYAKCLVKPVWASQYPPHALDPKKLHPSGNSMVGWTVRRPEVSTRQLDNA